MQYTILCKCVIITVQNPVPIAVKNTVHQRRKYGAKCVTMTVQNAVPIAVRNTVH